MNVPRAILLLLLVGPTVPGVWAQSELWDRASELAALSNGYAPRLMITTMEELNGDGSRKSLMETTLSLVAGANGTSPQWEVVRAVRDGKDVTAELQKSSKDGARRNQGSGASFGFDGMLFDAKERSKIRFLPDARWSVRDGRRVGVIPFSIDAGKLGTLGGSVEIDAESGIPAVASMTGRFPFVDHLSFDLEWAPFPAGGFVLSTMKMRGVMTFVFVKRAFRGSIEFRDYEKDAG